MTVIKIMDSDIATLELIDHQRHFLRIQQNLNDAFEHWQRLQNGHLQQVLNLDPNNPKHPELKGNILGKSFTLTLSPLRIENSLLGQLLVLSPLAGTKEEVIVAEYLLDKDGNVSTRKTGPKILRNETENPNYTLLMNILNEVLQH